jgi:hypothetical protein
VNDPWRTATATGLGPFPGTDPREAARILFDELPELPHMPLLPALGFGGDPVARAAALLTDLHIDLQPSGWRLVSRPGMDERRVRAALTADLDALEEAGEGYQGDFKVQLLGPWTLAASLELRNLEKALADPGAVRDLAQSLREGLEGHLADLRRRLPGVDRLVVQFDEPLLTTVLGGQVPTASGWGRLWTVEEQVAEDVLRPVLAGAGDHAGVHFGDSPHPGRNGPAAGLPVALVRRAGAAFLGVDAALLASVDEDVFGQALEEGMGLLVAAVPLEEPYAGPRSATRPIWDLWKRLGLAMDLVPRRVAVTPVDGLEQLAPGRAAAILRRSVGAARFLEETAGEEAS